MTENQIVAMIMTILECQKNGQKCTPDSVRETYQQYFDKVKGSPYTV
jgi:hypothetical protein